MDVRVPFGQSLHRGRPWASRRCAAVATVRLRELSERRAAPGGFFLKIRCPHAVHAPFPLLPPPLSLLRGGGRRGNTIFAFYSPIVHVVV